MKHFNFKRTGPICSRHSSFSQTDVRVIAEQNGRRESGYAGGGRYDHHYFSQDNHDLEYAKKRCDKRLLT